MLWAELSEKKLNLPFLVILVKNCSVQKYSNRNIPLEPMQANNNQDIRVVR